MTSLSETYSYFWVPAINGSAFRLQFNGSNNNTKQKHYFRNSLRIHCKKLIGTRIDEFRCRDQYLKCCFTLGLFYSFYCFSVNIQYPTKYGNTRIVFKNNKVI